MSRFSLQYINTSVTNNSLQNNLLQNNPLQNKPNNIFDKDMNYYVCSFGGCGSTVLANYLSNFGNVYHIHDRFPPNELTYVGKNNTNEDIHDEWFNNVKIPYEKLSKYKVIFIYRNPIEVIFTRFAQRHGPNVKHLQNIKCDNDGNINFYDVLYSKRDLYKMEEFFDNYTNITNRNYNIYCIKYEFLFNNNFDILNYILGIPNIKQLCPVKQERPRKYQYINELRIIYKSLLYKMSKLNGIQLIKPHEFNVTV